MTVRNIANHQPVTLTAVRRSQTTARKSPAFATQDHFTAPASRRTLGRQLLDASLNGRQFFATAAAPAATTPAADAAVKALPFYIANPNFDSTNPESPTMIQDPTATAAPQRVQWTSSNGLTTTGVTNPFGLTKNNPSIGFNLFPSGSGATS